MKKVLFYEKTLELISEKLLEERSLKSLSDKLNVNYGVLSDIKRNRATKKYPNIISKLLDYYGYEAQYEMIYIVKKRNS